MKLGILQCDDVREELREEYHSYPEMFQNLFHSVDRGLSYRVYDVVEEIYPAKLDECDAYLITGSAHSAYEDLAWISRLSSFIRLLDQKRKTLIGICFGHQIIAQALGGSVREEIEKGWGVGIIDFNNFQKEWFSDAHQGSISLLMSHKDQVYSLPEGCVVTQGDEFCPIAGFIKNKHILTFQGHPEFSKEFLKALIEPRRALIGEAKYQRALSSLNQETDAKKVAAWILNFVQKGANRSSR